MLQRSALVLSGFALLCGLGCASSFADPTGRQNSLEKAQRDYTNAIRWGEIKRAAGFVEPEMREEFLGYADAFEKIQITDADYDPLGIEPVDDRAEVEVTYHAISLATFNEKKFVATQEWTRHDGVYNTWRVRPEIGEIVRALRVDAD
ncbi:MAG: hypothetical protein ACE5FL_15365 [Myxococcota bacterium]